jgi:ribonuclease HII
MYESSNAMIVAGVDEAGRGPLAGSVIAAAVILDPMSPIAGLTDSKKLSAKQRGHLEVIIKRDAACWALGEATCIEIDEINILQASLLAMKRAILGLNITPEQVLVDGNKTPKMSGYVLRAIIKGDLTEPSISAASILAKEFRDRQMIELDQQYPQYQFARHKGYPTALHRELLNLHGPCPQHRCSFKPVRECYV